MNSHHPASTDHTPLEGPFHDSSIDSARRQYVELFGSALVMNTYLKIALVCVCLIASGLLLLNFRTLRKYEQVKPLVIRIDEVGRAQAVQYDALTYRPEGQAPELKYFLIQFVTKHFGRMRSTVKRNHAESLYFLNAELAEATIAENQRHQTIETFLTDTSDEIEINVRNVALEELRTPPYRASVDFEKVYYAVGNRQERARELCVAQILFVLRDQVPNGLIPVNPLGLTVTYVRVDQAFR
jgi:type IV secretory pathway TrbF-like protein